MTRLKKLSVFLAIVALAGFLGTGLSSCSKRNAELETDYATKKASAETLMGQITSSMTTMKDDHAKWMAALDDASKKHGADTTKLNALRNDMQKHMADANTIMALEDSVKSYMSATPDKADEFKNADDRLGTNFNDLSDKWKSFQDAHSKLGQDINAATVAAAGAPMKDTVKAKEEIKKAAPKKEAAKTEIKTEAHGVPRKSAK
ncbi:MAG: hypothetical protein Q8922_10010 [Bacteroidota bacterium]|nr:hypothetical protein [Bacteroidota bacterium]MDP4232388.1 hypothetical protein [Bacteroidota bacterium]MDP4241525.1 hypothetical protein [Bacteroidota bacterium]MDP4288259.1 hypothetical protein [Bacteroidota bacterium]